MLWAAGYAHFWHTPLTPYQLPVCMSGANSSIWYLLRIFISAFGVYHRSPHRLWWYLSTTSGIELSPDFPRIFYAVTCQLPGQMSVLVWPWGIGCWQLCSINIFMKTSLSTFYTQRVSQVNPFILLLLKGRHRRFGSGSENLGYP